MIVVVAYLAPVHVLVDVTAGVVERVVVLDSQIVPDVAGVCAVQGGGLVPGWGPVAVEAYSVAARVSWPQWEHERGNGG